VNREQVFTLIDDERIYQNNLPHHNHEQDVKTPVAAWLIYMEKHLENAKERIYYLDQPLALEEVRKLAALAVACMEHNDTRGR
jgi:hypothetical protein